MEDSMRVIDSGHIYELNQLGGGTQQIVFVKRSGGAISYTEEWPGLQVQEVIRVLIDRTKYLNAILPCNETQNALQFLRLALFEFEARAWRRKQEQKNRKDGSHDDSADPKPWRAETYEDVPFNELGIELRPVGSDGHIIWDEHL